MFGRDMMVFLILLNFLGWFFIVFVLFWCFCFFIIGNLIIVFKIYLLKVVFFWNVLVLFIYIIFFLIELLISSVVKIDGLVELFIVFLIYFFDYIV